MNGPFLSLATLRGVPIRVHWTAIFGVFLFSGLAPSVTGVCAFFGLVIVHELGHAFVARRRGLRVHAIVVHAMGGYCTHDAGTEIDRESVAWGGVLAQAWLALVLETAMRVVPRFVDDDAGYVLSTQLDFVQAINLRLILINLIPAPPLDGAFAWKLVLRLLRGVRPPLTSAAIAAEIRAMDRDRATSPVAAAPGVSDEEKDDEPERTRPDVTSLVQLALDRAKRDARATDRDADPGA